ncbi:putative E3 ubiquitin-protein ligase XERICO [Trifolium repens]|nr:putative E3 ubiquitin-protein ligase XERICO [Trifolium repens]
MIASHQFILITPTQFFLQLPMSQTLTNFTTNVNDHFLIPSEILCNCDTNTIINANQNTLFLYNIFNFVPTHVLDTILCQMGDVARQMIALNVGRCGILEMNVLLHVTSSIYSM